MNNDQPSAPTPIHVVFEVSDHETLGLLLDQVRECSLPVETVDIREGTLSADAVVELNLGELTTKQRESLKLALEEGYYSRPREANLDLLADRLHISKSAVSQRLRSAERNLIKSALDDYI